MAGTNEVSGENWVMSMGHFMALFDDDWLGIKASRKVVMLKYAEFNFFETGIIMKTGWWRGMIRLMLPVRLHPLTPTTGSLIFHLDHR